MRNPVKVHVKQTGGKLSTLTMKLQWNQENDEVSEKVWQAVGSLLREVLDEDQKAHFLTALNEAQAKIAATAKPTKQKAGERASSQDRSKEKEGVRNMVRNTAEVNPRF